MRKGKLVLLLTAVLFCLLNGVVLGESIDITYPAGNGLKYVCDENNQCAVGENLTYDPTDGALVIPGSFEVDHVTYTVTSISKDAFFDSQTESANQNLKSVTIPASVTEIGENAFNFCALESVSFDGDSQLTTIGDYAFSHHHLKNITIPDKVETIGAYAFMDNYQEAHLETLTFAEESNLKTIGENAFAFTNALESINIPASVTSIGDNAFMGSAEKTNKLTSVTFAEGSQLKTIGDSAFSWRNALKSIEIPASVTSIGDNAFKGCGSLESLTFAGDSNLKTIGEGAFDSTALVSVVIPASVTSIGWGAFGCDNLNTVTFAEGSQLKTIGEQTFERTALERIEIPASVTSIGDSAFKECESLSSVTFAGDSHLKTIGERTFESTALESIEIPASVETIGNSAFASCESLVSVTFAGESAFGDSILSLDTPSSTRKIYACQEVYDRITSDSDLRENYGIESTDQVYFYGPVYSCADTECTVTGYEGTVPADLVIPAEHDGKPVTAIGKEAFKQNTALYSVVIPTSVTSIGDGAFSGCTNLEKVTFAGNRVFGDSILSLETPSSTRQIYACREVYDRIREMTLEQIKANFGINGTDQVHIFGPVYSCTDTECTVTGYEGTVPADLVIPAEYDGKPVTAIGDYAFSYSNALESIEIPASVTSIGSGAFKECESLVSVTFAGDPKLETIGKAAFDNTALASIKIPASVTSIGDNAFASCERLASVTFAGESAFGDSILSLGDTPSSTRKIYACQGVYDRITTDNYFSANYGIDNLNQVHLMGNLAEAGVRLTDSVYKGAEQYPDVKIGDTTLTKDTDYTITVYTSDGTTPVPEPINAGSYKVKLTGTVNTDDNGTPYYGSVTKDWNIAKAERLELTVSVTGWIYGAYDDSANAPVFSPDLPQDYAADLYLSYEKDGNSVLEIRTADAGDYTLTAVFFEGANYLGKTLQPASFTISKAELPDDLTVSVSGWTYGAYNAESNSPVFSSVLPTDGKVSFSYYKGEDPVSDITTAGVGEYSVIADIAAGTNYNEGSVTSDPFTISKAELPTGLTVSVSGWTYGADPNAPVLTGLPEDGAGTVTYTYKKGEETVPDITKAGAGGYTVTADIAAGTNYNAGSVSDQFTIEKAPLPAGLTVSVTGWTYGAAPKAPVLTGLPEDGAGTVTYTYKKGEETVPDITTAGAGGYTVIADIAAGTNYLGSSVTSDPFSIAKADINVNDYTAPTALPDLIYNGQEHELIAAGSSDAGTMVYMLSAQNGGKALSGYSTEIPTATDAGTYTVLYAVEPDGNHLEPDGAIGSVEATIRQDEITADSFSLDRTAFLYAEGQTQKPALNAGSLVEGTDYEIAAGSDKEASEPGEYALTINGKGNYSGSVKLNWAIIAPHPTDTSIVIQITDDGSQTISLGIGKIPEDIRIEWTSTDPDTVTVTPDPEHPDTAVVSGTGEGTAWITATVKDSSGSVLVKYTWKADVRSSILFYRLEGRDVFGESRDLPATGFPTGRD